MKESEKLFTAVFTASPISSSISLFVMPLSEIEAESADNWEMDFDLVIILVFSHMLIWFQFTGAGGPQNTGQSVSDSKKRNLVTDE